MTLLMCYPPLIW